MREEKFTWIGFYTEFASKLLAYKDNRAELIGKIKRVYEEIGIKLPKLENDNNDVRDIDPFTVFGLFNKGIAEATRIKIIRGFASEFSIEASIPESFDGVPVLNNLKATFYWFEGGRGDQDIDNLWNVYEAALELAREDTADHREQFSLFYDRVIAQTGVRWNITMGLYWIRPYYFVNLDSRNREFLRQEGNMPFEYTAMVRSALKKLPSADVYLEIRDRCQAVMDSGAYEYHNFPELSFFAWNDTRSGGEWLPEDYDPAITVDMWCELLADREVFTTGSLEIMKRMKDAGGMATCKQLSAKYGETQNFYNVGSSALARRVIEKTGCPVYERDDDSVRYWPVLYQGRSAGKTEMGSFVWKLRDELAQALDQMDLSNISLHAMTPLGDADVDTIRYWVYAPGQGAEMWEEFLSDGIMALGWDEIGDLNAYKSKAEMRRKLQEELGGDTSYKNSVHALWQFVHEMKPGDIVFAKRGRTEILGKGIVESEYSYDEEGGGYPNIRKVRWTHEGSWQLSETLPLKTLTDVTDYTDMKAKLLALFDDASDEDEIVETAVSYPAYTKEDFLREVFISEKEYDTLTVLLKNKMNLILQGAPGVGKTFLAKRLAYSIMGEKDADRVMMVQFHQSYSYEDFIMGFRPSAAGFELKKGAFYNFCKKAEVDSENDYFFIIDEINRGNLSKIFGELFMLIEGDKRGSRNKIRLLYSDELFFVPDNVYIIGMMNTADRSLAMLDYALRRRFAFYDLKPGFSSDGFRAYRERLNHPKFDRLIQATQRLNEAIEKDDSLGEGFCIGHSYFCNLTPDEVSDDKLSGIVEYELIPLLKEYWFDEPGKVRDWSDMLRSALN